MKLITKFCFALKFSFWRVRYETHHSLARETSLFYCDPKKKHKNHFRSTSIFKFIYKPETVAAGFGIDFAQQFFSSNFQLDVGIQELRT